jgi:hypothetical protein
MRARVALSAAGALLLLALVLVGATHQVAAWREVMRRDDVRFVTTPVERNMWAAPRSPGAGLTEDLLALGDDIRFRQAERLYVRGHITATTFAEEKARLSARGAAVELLEETIARDSAAWRRARAANLLGILLFEDSREGQGGAPALSRQAVSAFRTGSRQEEGADESRFNLELLLTLLRPDGGLGRDLSEDQRGAASGVGAGLAVPKGGY